MRLLIPGLVGLLLIAPVQAQSADTAVAPTVPAASVAPTAPAASVTSVAPKAAGAVSAAAAQVSQEVADVKASFDKVYADTSKDASPSTRLLATATGAGLGFLASSYILTTTIAPLAATALNTVGLSQATTSIVTSSITTIGLVWGTYVGGVYAHDLVAR